MPGRRIPMSTEIFVFGVCVCVYIYIYNVYIYIYCIYIMYIYMTIFCCKSLASADQIEVSLDFKGCFTSLDPFKRIPSKDLDVCAQKQTYCIL